MQSMISTRNICLNLISNIVIILKKRIKTKTFICELRSKKEVLKNKLEINLHVRKYNYFYRNILGIHKNFRHQELDYERHKTVQSRYG